MSREPAQCALSVKYSQRDHINEWKMGQTCSRKGRAKRRTQNFRRKTVRKEPTWHTKAYIVLTTHDMRVHAGLIWLLTAVRMKDLINLRETYMISNTLTSRINVKSKGFPTTRHEGTGGAYT